MAKKAIRVECKTPLFRLSFEKLYVPSGFEGAKDKYSMSMVFPANTDFLTDIKMIGGFENGHPVYVPAFNMKAAYNKVLAATWPDKDDRPSTMRNPFRIGNKERAKDAIYRDSIFVNASASIEYPPGLGIQEKTGVDKNGKAIYQIRKAEKGEIYSGCFCRASLSCYSYNTKGNAGVTFGIVNVLKVRDGEPLTGGKPIEQDMAGFVGMDVGDDSDDESAYESNDAESDEPSEDDY